jgi:hypothetical protein
MQGHRPATHTARTRRLPVSRDFLPRWLWLWLPIAVALLPFIARMGAPATDRVFYGEFGVLENLTVLFLLVGVLAGIGMLAGRTAPQAGPFRAWVLLIVLGAVYFAGEEISWGQHFFGWGTPEPWARINEQAETNLHNTSSLFNQLPRTLLTLAALFGGVVAPLWIRSREAAFAPGSVAAWLWPTLACLPAAALAVAISWPGKILRATGIDQQGLDIGPGETKEALLGLFIMIYLLSLARRVRLPAS